MNFDIYSILLSLVMIVVGYFIIKKLPVILVGVIGFGLIIVMSLFVLRDMVHVPVNDYVDTTEIDLVLGQASDYTNEKLLGTPDDDTGGVVDNSVDDGVEKNKLDRIEKYKYDEMNDNVIGEMIDRYTPIVDDNSFENKLRGMTPYVDISYEFSNLKMYSSEDREYLIIELIK